MTFGALPGWWLSEDGRRGGPLITQEEWHRQLQLAEFSGLDAAAAAKDKHNVAHFSMMVSTKPVLDHLSPSLRKLLIVKPLQYSEIGDSLAKEILNRFSPDMDVEMATLEVAASIASQGHLSRPGLVIVSLLESDEPILAHCSKETFEYVRTVILNTWKLLWVTCSASSDGARDPESCAISGLFRTARSENPRLRLYELHLQKRPVSETGDLANHVARTIRVVHAAKEEDEIEDELVEANGQLTIPRLLDEEHLNRTLQTLGSVPKPEPQLLLQHDRPLKLTVGKPGLLDSLHFVDDDVSATHLPDDHVEVQVEANALNSRYACLLHHPSYFPPYGRNSPRF